MKIVTQPVLVALSWGVGVGIALSGGLAGCAGDRNESAAKPANAGNDSGLVAGAAGGDALANDALKPLPQSPTAAASTVGTQTRVGGDLSVAVSRDGDVYRSGLCKIDTPLPVGYPGPTPPGAIDLKYYPSVRRAEYAGKGLTGAGPNSGFWPLFMHIKKRDIEMTAPVEMDYKPAADKPTPESSWQSADWKMSFLYREKDLGPTGELGKIQVVDTQPMTYLSVGLIGTTRGPTIAKGLDMLRQFIDANPQYKVVGDPRGLFYNGPDVRADRQWAEIQLPVEIVTGNSVP